MGNGTELGSFLKACRARRTPEQAGVTAGSGPRRTPGLRREEVAGAAGMSMDYYTRLEQGRERNPSDAVLESLAGVLGLDRGEHRHLLNLARNTTSGRSKPQPGRPAVRPSALQLLDSVQPCPAYLLDRINNLLATNAAGNELLTGMDQWPQQRRNTYRYMFRHPSARTLFVNWHEVALNSVAHLRAVFGDNPYAPDLRELVDELSTTSEEFDGMWRRNEVQPKSGGVKCFDHPAVGRMDLTYEALNVSGTDQTLVVYQATAESPDHDAMTLLDLAARNRAGADPEHRRSAPRSP